jgi:hypothetical protein
MGGFFCAGFAFATTFFAGVAGFDDFADLAFVFPTRET